MIAKTIALLAFVAAVNAGIGAPVSYLAADHHVGAQSEQTVRGFGGLSSVTQYSKAVDGAFSSVRKTDTRVTNDAVHAVAVPTYAHQTYAAAPLAVAHHGYAAAPLAAVAHHGYAHQAYAAAPVASYGHQTYSAAPLAVAHHAPAYAHQTYAAAPVAAVAHHGYAAAPLAVANHGYAAGLGHAYGAQVNHHYSAVSPAVATFSFDGVGLGHYGY